MSPVFKISLEFTHTKTSYGSKLDSPSIIAQMKVIKLLANNTKSQKNALAEAVAELKAGGLVIYPTETVYGAGVDATNQAAVDKLLKYKTRREGKPLSIAVADEAMAAKYVEINEQAAALYQSLLPGPVTVISKGLGKVAKGVESEFATLGVRIPDYNLVVGMAEQLDRPITATSANTSGKPRPYSIPQLLKSLSTKQKNLIDLIIDAGKLPKNPPSTVIDTTHSAPVTLRSGKIALPSSAKTQIDSASPTETRAIAGKLLLKNWSAIQNQGLVIGLNGPLGAGKTVFAKGMADFLQIKVPLVSPTYSYIEEYRYHRHQTRGTFYHLDMWKVADLALFERLEVEKLLEANNVLAIEWFAQVKDYLREIIKEKKVEVLELEILDLADDRRRIIVGES